MSPDVRLFHLINGLAGRSAVVDTVARLLVSDYMVPTTLALLLLALWFTPGRPAERTRNQVGVLRTALALFLANVIVKGFNLIYFRPRPLAVMEAARCFYQPTDSSLPSNPATVGFAVATAVYLHHRPAGLLMFGLAIGFAVSRVYCGVHYPLDILAGAVVGSLSALIVVRYLHVFDRLWGSIIALARRLYLA